MTAVYQVFAISLLLCCVQAKANVFGDGDPRNGVEDDRTGLNSPRAPGRPLDRWRNSAGTIHCEGRNRGSAMILDVTHVDAEAPGTFLATAAHVLVDLRSGEPFRDCEFQFLALGQLAHYRAGIDRKWISAGPFQVEMDSSSPVFGEHDWAFVWLPPDRPHPKVTGRIRPAAYESVLTSAGNQARFLLVAWDRAAGGLGVSAPCTVVQSTPHDLGGGAWRGHLLDDCDSGDGASGGGLVADTGRDSFLVGIRSGAHWSPDAYPLDTFPLGPPAGAPWDVRRNTNYARAIDTGMLANLRELVVRASAWTRDVASAR